MAKFKFKGCFIQAEKVEDLFHIKDWGKLTEIIGKNPPFILSEVFFNRNFTPGDSDALRMVDPDRDERLFSTEKEEQNE